MQKKQTEKLVRHHDWQDRLNTYLDIHRDDGFEWGKHDCLIFAAGAVKAQTGVDLSEGVGEYSDEVSAENYLFDHNYKTLIAAVSSKLGKKVHAAHAGKGDIVLRGKPKGAEVSAIGVCAGHWSWFVGERLTQILPDGTQITTPGLVQVPTLDCVAAWKVGHVDG